MATFNPIVNKFVLADKYLKFFIYHKIAYHDFPKESFGNIEFYASELQLVTEYEIEVCRQIAIKMNEIWIANYAVFGE